MAIGERYVLRMIMRISAGWDQGVLETIKKNFWFEPKRTETQSVSVVFGLFRETKLIFSVCFGVSDQYRNNRNKPKKVSKKQISIRVSSKQLIFFFFGSDRNKPKLSLFWLFFGQFFAKPNKKIFRFVSVFRTGIKTTETNRTYGMGNQRGLYFNKFAAVSFGLLFVSVVSKHRNSLFRYYSETTKTNILFRIVPKLVSVVSI